MNPPASQALVNAMTVDVEDYFQVSAMEPHVPRAAWETTPLRVQANVERILGLFAEHGVKATFFTLGWVAERHPQMVRRIVAEGHELASHGWEHIRVNTQQPEAFRADVTRTKALLEDLGGVAVNGYRAASYSIGRDNLWALDVLADAGYRYSSSIAPININCGGGGWFRLFPYGFSRWALRRINQREGQSGHFYFHPWEIDPEQPRPAGVSARTRFRHYLNLERMEPRLRRLLGDFRWDRMDRVFAGQIADPAGEVAPAGTVFAGQGAGA